MTKNSFICLFSQARRFCHENGGNLWYPSEPLVTGHIADHPDAMLNRPISGALIEIFDLFDNDLESQERTHLELAWTSIQRQVQKGLVYLFNS